MHRSRFSLFTLLVATLQSYMLLPLLRTVLGLRRGLVQVPIVEPPPAGPLVSVIVPARNEERTIEHCVTTLLNQSYPSIEVIVLNDRSTDRTGAILDRLSANDQRLRVLTGASLPEDWVGKTWAMHQAAQAARGEWLLFVDSDTFHRPGMLASALSYAREKGADLLTLGPHQELKSLPERALLPAVFGAIVAMGGTIDEVNDPNHPLAKANGQFMLFRRSIFDRIGGYESVRGEIVDDFAMARRVKGTGHRLVLAGGRDLLSVRMYHSALEIWEGFSKNTYFEARRSPSGAIGGLALLWLAPVVPPTLFLLQLYRLRKGEQMSWRNWAVLVQSACQILILSSFSIQMVQLLRLPIAWALSFPTGLVFLSFVLINSTVRVLTGRGVSWRGRVYGKTRP